jgi:hypothetical protein
MMQQKNHISIIFILLVFCHFSCGNSNSQIQNKIDNPQSEKIDTIKFTVDPHNNKSPLWNKIVFSAQFSDTELNCFLDNCESITLIDNKIFENLCSDSSSQIINREDLSYIRHHEGVYRETIKCPLNISLNQYVLHLDTVIKTNDIIGNVPFCLAIELFQKNIVEIDFQQDIILLHQILPEKAKTYEVWNLFVDKRYNQWRRVKMDGFMSENGKQISGTFIVDLGASISLLFPPFVEELSFEKSIKDTTTEAYRFLSIVGHRIKNHRPSGGKNNGSPLLNMELSGHIGMDFLLYYNLIFDYSTNKLYLKRR